MAEHQTTPEESASTRNQTMSKKKAISGVAVGQRLPGVKTNTLKHAITVKGAQLVSPADISGGKHQHHHHHHHHHRDHGQGHVIHRTTSESLRLGEIIANSSTVSNSSSLYLSSSGGGGSTTSSSGSTTGGNMTISQLHFGSAPFQRKPKTSSFQITSVTVGNKPSTDNGEDSADDLDESHTDDNSRVTDLENETPSMSEDTFSKEDVFFSSNALGTTAPVIPTSSQYGLVIVDPDMANVGTGGQNIDIQNVHVSVTDAGINIVGPASAKLGDVDEKGLHQRSERFKVVKIESTEPFRRGRWMCMDYLDHTTLQQEAVTSDANASECGTNGGGGSIGGTHPETNDSGVILNENHVDKVAEQLESLPNHTSPGQTIQTLIPISGTAPPDEAGSSNIGQSQMPAQQQHAQSVPFHETQSVLNDNYIPGQSQPTHFFINQHQQIGTVSSQPVHGATLPANITMQNGVPINIPSHNQLPPQQQQTSTQQSANLQCNQSGTQTIQPQNINSMNVAVGINSSLPMVDQQSPQSQSQQPISQSVAMSQPNAEVFVPQPVVQSFATASTNVTPTLPQSQPVQDVLPSDTALTQLQSSASPQQSQQQFQQHQQSSGNSNVASPVAAVNVPIDTQQIPSLQAQPIINPVAGQTMPIVHTMDSVPASHTGTPATIGDPTAIVVQIQTHQTAPNSGNTINVVEEGQSQSQQPTINAETEIERVSSLSRALSTADASYVSEGLLPVYAPSLNMFNRDVENGNPSNVYTNIALCNNMQKIMGITAPDKVNEEKRAPLGIQIPPIARNQYGNVNFEALAKSCPFADGHSYSPFIFGSPPASVQIAYSYDPYLNVYQPPNKKNDALVSSRTALGECSHLRGSLCEVARLDARRDGI